MASSIKRMTCFVIYGSLRQEKSSFRCLIDVNSPIDIFNLFDTIIISEFCRRICYGRVSESGRSAFCTYGEIT